MDPSPCAALTHSRLVDFYGLFHRVRIKFLVEIQQSTGPILLPYEYAAVACVRRGGICFKSNLG